MPPKKKRQHRVRPPPEDPGPLRPSAKRSFAPGRPFPPSHTVRPGVLADSDVVQERAVELLAERGYVSGAVRQRLGKFGRPLLPEALSAAAARSGHKGVHQRIFGAAEKQAAAVATEERRPKPPPVGSVEFDDQQLRRVFNVFDIGKRDVVGAKELRHVFALLGEMPRDSDIDGMIALCDCRGDGAVSFEDFLGIFSNPAESLRGVDAAHLREVVDSGGKSGDESAAVEEEEDDEDEMASDSGSGSSLEPQ